MTAIAFRDGVMAADRGAWRGNVRYGGATKIARSPSGALGAAAGYASVCEQFKKWLENAGFEAGDPFDPQNEKDSDFAAIIAVDARHVYAMDHKGRIHLRPRHAFHTEGGCEDFLAGAMAAGASAEEAVKLAVKYHGNASGGVQVEKLR